MDDLISRQAAISEIMEDLEDRSLHDDPATPEDFAEGYDEGIRNAAAIVLQMPPAQPGCEDAVYRKAVQMLLAYFVPEERYAEAVDGLRRLPSAQPDADKYEYHYDHTDCIWYRPEARNRCPVTCAQYRDGWNDAMNYIFRDGQGYRPYRRDERYER